MIMLTPSVTPVTASQTATGPNIYLVLLDGYPRRDTLLDDLGIDNGPFEEALGGRGFDVYDDATTDRRYTDFTYNAANAPAGASTTRKVSSTVSARGSAQRRLGERTTAAGLSVTWPRLTRNR